jgi:hypothetical protein
MSGLSKQDLKKSLPGQTMSPIGIIKLIHRLAIRFILVRLSL